MSALIASGCIVCGRGGFGGFVLDPLPASRASERVVLTACMQVRPGGFMYELLHEGQVIASGGSWWLLVASDGISRLLVASGGFWRLRMAPDGGYPIGQILAPDGF